MSTTQANKTSESGSMRVRGLLVVFVAFCVLGVAVSAELTWIHIQTHTNPTYESICSVSDTINCKTVAQSPYSVLFGLPVSVWGIVGYGLMIFIAASGIGSRRFGFVGLFIALPVLGPAAAVAHYLFLGEWVSVYSILAYGGGGLLACAGLFLNRLGERWPLGALLGLAAVSMGMSSYLAYISFTKIDSLCVFCTALYLVNLILLILIIAAVAGKKANPVTLVVEDIKSLIARPAVLSPLAAVPLVAVGVLLVGVEPYWQHAHWLDLPDLPSGVDEDGCHWIGAEDADVTVVEFSDYECPHCRRAHKEMRALAAQYPGNVRFVHKHFPLDDACNPAIKKPFHRRACEFAKAAECAGEQDQFWEMNDALFSSQETMKAVDIEIETLAVQLGMDRSVFVECMASSGVPACVKDHMRAAKRLRLPGTPYYYIGTQSFQGGIPPAALESALEKVEKESP